MPQASDLGQIPNQARTLYRGRVNVCMQALASFNEGPSAPSVTYPNMIWADTGSGTVKQRNLSNSAWVTIGTQGDHWTFTNIDLPAGYAADKIADSATKVIMTIAERNRLKMYVTPQEFGAVGNGIADDTAAFISAAATCVNNKVAFYIPAGRYILKQQISFSNSSVGVFGAGHLTTELRWASDASSSGLWFGGSLNNQMQTIKDLTLSTASSGLHGTAITLDYSGAQIDLGAPSGLAVINHLGPGTYIENVFMCGSRVIDQPNTSGNAQTGSWEVGVDVICGIACNIHNCSFTGMAADQFVPVDFSTAFQFRGSVLGQYSNGHPNQFVVSNVTVFFASTGVYFDNCEGGYVSHSNFVAVGQGVSIYSVHSHPQLNVSNTHVNASRYGIYVNGQTQVTITGCLIYAITTPVQDFSAVRLENSFWFVVSNNIFGSINTTGYRVYFVQVTSGGNNGVISNNICFGGSDIDACIVLQSGSYGIKGTNNIFAGSPVRTILDDGSGNSVS